MPDPVVPNEPPVQPVEINRLPPWVQERLNEAQVVRARRAVEIVRVAEDPPGAIARARRWWNEPGLPVKKDTTMKGKRGEELYNLILSGIREIYDVSAVISGGAVRDLATGNVEGVKDVDVFLPLTWDTFSKQMLELGWVGTPQIVKTKSYKNPDCDVFKSTARALGNVQGIQVDLVFIDGGLTPDMVKSFPVHAQRGIYTLENGLDLSPEAKEDIDGKKFTISPKITEKAHMEPILKKVNEWKKRPYYKDWTIVEPDVKEWWEAKEELKVKESKKPIDPFVDYWARKSRIFND